MAKFMPITQEVFDEGGKRGAAPRPRAASAEFDAERRRVVIRLDTGLDLSFDPDAACGLEHADAHDLGEIEVAGAGGAIHFTRLDVFLSIPRLLEGFLGPLEWSRREARATASRRNGKLGGRPKKVPEFV